MYGTYRDAVQGKGTDAEKYERMKEWFAPERLLRCVPWSNGSARPPCRSMGARHAQIGKGLLVLLGIEVGDTEADLEWLCGKLIGMRIFPDDRRGDEPRTSLRCMARSCS